jgi:uncharacterized protein YgiM (DUF1202 family)
MRRMLLAMTLLSATSVSLLAAETTRWVERTKVDVRAGRGSFHDIVDTVLKGEQVEVLQSTDRWLSVRTPRSKTGWVFESALASKPVSAAGSDADFLKLAPGDASTSRTAASAGAKGAYAQEYAQAKGYDYSIVGWVETHQPSSVQIEAFIKDSGDGGRP